MTLRSVEWRGRLHVLKRVFPAGPGLRLTFLPPVSRFFFLMVRFSPFPPIGPRQPAVAVALLHLTIDSRDCWFPTTRSFPPEFPPIEPLCRPPCSPLAQVFLERCPFAPETFVVSFSSSVPSPPSPPSPDRPFSPPHHLLQLRPVFKLCCAIVNFFPTHPPFSLPVHGRRSSNRSSCPQVSFPKTRGGYAFTMPRPPFIMYGLLMALYVQEASPRS